MLFKSLIRIITCLIFFTSCASTDENANAIESYSLINSSIQLSKGAYQALIGKYRESLNAVNINENAKIDTIELRVVLDSAKLTNQQSLSMINLAGEIDTTWYKEKALNYIHILDILYNNEFEKYISLFGTQSKYRYIKGNELLSSRQLELKKLDKEFSYASDKIKSKYHLQIVDSLK